MIFKMYMTLMPVILAGICNMFFVKTTFYKRFNKPMDGGRCLKDNRRILGENKTWIGFLGMVVFGAILQLIWGEMSLYFPDIQAANYLYIKHSNMAHYNILVGALLGFSYMLFELPNSFIKRRLAIRPGKTEQGIRGVFFLVDQVDSLFGVALVVALFGVITLGQYFLIIVLGAFTHIGVNLILYGLHIRKNL